MKKNTLYSVLTPLLIGSLTLCAPQMGFAQAAPSASAEGKAAPAKRAPRAKRTEVVSADVKPLELVENYTDTYTVVKGDTLWGISSRFLKEPWRWPEIWNLNRDQIRNPHLIYPGEVIQLGFDANGRPQLSLAGGGGSSGMVKLSPQTRSSLIGSEIPSIPTKAIGPFLSQPLVVEAGGLEAAPQIVGTEEGRVIVGSGNFAYATGITEAMGQKWQVFRPGKPLRVPGSEEILGYEAMYLGDAKVVRFGVTTKLDILKSTQEINRGDRLTPVVETVVPTYVPRAPSKKMSGSVLSILGGVNEGGQYSIISLSLGKRDGVEVGHVFASSTKGVTVETNTIHAADASFWGSVDPSRWFETDAEKAKRLPDEVMLPDERNGLVFVFRTFDKVSYALVMSSRRQLVVGDVVLTP